MQTGHSPLEGDVPGCCFWNCRRGPDLVSLRDMRLACYRYYPPGPHLILMVRKGAAAYLTSKNFFVSTKLPASNL